MFEGWDRTAPRTATSDPCLGSRTVLYMAMDRREKRTGSSDVNAGKSSICVFPLHGSIKEKEACRGGGGQGEEETCWGLASCFGKFVDDCARCCLMLWYVNTCACCCCLKAYTNRRNKVLFSCHQTHGVERPTSSVSLIGMERGDSRNYSLRNHIQVPER